MADHRRETEKTDTTKSEATEDGSTEVARTARHSKNTRRRKSIMREIIEMIALVAFVVFIVAGFKYFIMDVYAVPTGSMIPTIEINDRIVAEKISPHISDIKAQEIVTFKDPIQGDGRILVKRVIAVAGQQVDLRSGIVYVNGVALDEPYTYGRPSNPLQTKAGVSISYPFTVPPDTIWVMGDNRTDSLDSRYFGPVGCDQVTGHGVLRIWPLDRLGTL